VANGGFGGRVAADLRVDDKQRWGAMAYWMTSVLELTQLTPFDLEIVLDGQRHACGEALGLAIANGRFVGGGFPIAPNATLDDGLLDAQRLMAEYVWIALPLASYAVALVASWIKFRVWPSYHTRMAKIC